MAIPTLGAMIAAMGSPAEWGAVDTAKLYWDNTNFRLGVGAASPNAMLSVYGSVGASETTILSFYNSTSGGLPAYGIGMGPVNTEGFLAYRAGITSSASYGHKWLVNNVELMRLSGQGTLSIGFSNPASSIRLGVMGLGTTGTTASIMAYDLGGGSCNFYIQDNGVGYLRAAAWSYSDKKNKENITTLSLDSTSKIKALKPIKFDIKGDGPKNNLGFLAEDVQAIIPEAVAVNPMAAEPGELMICHDFLLPHVVQAIQEVIDRLGKLDKKSFADPDAWK